MTSSTYLWGDGTIRMLDDRAIGIIRVATLESTLEGVLRSSLSDFEFKSRQHVQTVMFENMGPLGSFSAKINLALMIGLITGEAWRDLSYVKDIRNYFAHDPNAHDFDSVLLRDKCKNIKWFETKLAEPPPHGQVHDFQKYGWRHFLPDFQSQLIKPGDRFNLACEVYMSAFSRIVSTSWPKPGLCKPRI